MGSMESEIWPLEKSQTICKCRGMFIPDSRVLWVQSTLDDQMIQIYVPKSENGKLKTAFYLHTISYCCQKWPLHCEAFKYRVSHGKVNKVIWLCWGHNFWFLPIFWVLWVHEKGTFMPNSSVFIFFYGSISQYFFSLINLDLFWLLWACFK